MGQMARPNTPKRKMGTKKGEGGGAAMGGGAGFQARGTAWLSAYMLAEQDAEPPFGLTSAIGWIGSETTEEVDDILVRMVGGHSGVIQAKRTITLDTQRLRRGKLSPFASAIDQCVRYFLERKRGTSASAPLDPAHDRIVLLVGEESPATVRQTLRRVVARLRIQPAGEPLFAPTLNGGERDVLTRLLDRVRESWLLAENQTPTERELHEFLRFLYIEPAAVEAGEEQEREAKRILRASVLEDPNQAEQAWNTLLTVASGLITERASIGREELVRRLVAAGVRVRAPRSYRADIERLRAHSAKILERLADFSHVQLGAVRVQLDRPYSEALQAAAAGGSVLVAGEPGIGKSGALYTAAKALAAAGRDVVVLAAQDPPFSTLGQLRRELGLDHEVVEVLENWPGLDSAFLFVDALDAARTDASSQALRRLMSDVVDGSSRWHVIASIREYDARYGRDLRRTFAGAPPRGPCPPLAGPEFQNLRHLVVGRLTDEELAQLSTKSPALHALVSTAPPALAGLFSNVFNLRLAAELLESGTEPEAIRAAGSQLQLLDLYWAERVLGGGERHESHGREAVLRRAVQGMVQDRSLRVDWDRVGEDPSTSSALSDLLRAHVLIEWAPAPGASPDRSTLTFAHHVLFDYAVARVLFRITPQRLAELLISDPSLVLLARPSLVMHFHYLWDRGPQSRQIFWDSVLVLCGTTGIPEIGKLIGPGVAAELVRQIQELEVLTASLKVGNLRREAAESALHHVIRAVIAEEGITRFADRAEVWCTVADLLSRDLRKETAYPLQWLLSLLIERVTHPATDQIARIGGAARRLLEFAWRMAPRDRGLVIYAIQHVSRTFASDPAASAALLRRALEPEHLATHGSEEMFWIAQEIETLLTHDTDLVRDIYTAAFRHNETSESPTPMGGIVLPLRSTRRQDYESGLYSLKESYSAFLEKAPENAVIALNAALEAHAAREFGALAQEEAHFRFRGADARLLHDHGRTWDRGGRHDDVVEMLDHLQAYLEKLAGPDGPVDSLYALIRTLVREGRLAALWRRLLKLGTRYPDTAGQFIRELAWTPEILNSSETSYAAGDFIRAMLPHLADAERVQIEHAVLALPEDRPDDERKWAELDRDRLIGCMDEMQPVTEPARELLADLKARDEVPSNMVRGPSFGWAARNGEEEYLAGQGVPLEEPANQTIRALALPVTEFGATFRNKKPPAAEIEAAVPPMRALHDALKPGGTPGAHPEQLAHGWAELARAAEALAGADGLPCTSTAGAFAREVLLEASTQPLPRATVDADAKFNDPWWETPATRVDAACGLMLLAFDPTCADEEVLAAIGRLAQDSCPPVRFQIALRLQYLYRSVPDRCWELLEGMVAREQSTGVLQALLQGPLAALLPEGPDRVVALIAAIAERVAGRTEAKKVRNASLDVLARVYLWRTSEHAEKTLLEIADHPDQRLDEASHLVHFLRPVIALGPTDGSDPETDRARLRGLDLLLRLTRAAHRAFRRAVEPQGATTDSETSAKQMSQEEMQSLAHMIDAIGSDLYFQSGAYKSENGATVAEDVQARLLHEAGPIIDELADVGLASLAHHLFETLEVLIPYDPATVFRRIAAVIRGGRKGAYQHDSMAERVLVRVVERYLADYRAIFQAEEELRRSLVEVLDTFIGAGSLGARRLSYGLAEIFR